MADLQPDRSLVRSLLSKGLDLWLIDWGQPGRTERWLTIDDYVDDYIDAAVDRVALETGHDKVTLLGICEGGVFTSCYAALHPKKVKNLVITITPIDFHADVKDKAAHHGFLNVWTRSLDPEDIDKLVDTTGAGDLFAAGFLLGTARGKSLKDSLRLGAISAAEVIQHYGARPEADLKSLAGELAA